MEPFGRIFYDVNGTAHKRYGVSVTEPTAVVLRPDGWIGTMVNLREEDSTSELERYFKRIYVL